jgi:hypothetical protein
MDVGSKINQTVGNIPMRAIWTALAITCALVPGVIKADVVYQQNASPTLYWSAQGTTWSSGQSFQNIAQDATVDSVLFKLRKTGSTAFTGTFSVKIYAATGTANNYLPNTASLFATSAAVSGASISGSASDVTFNGFTTNTNLVAGSVYVAVLDLTSLGGLSGTDSLEIGAISPIPGGTYASFNWVQNAGSGFSATTNQQTYGTIQVTAIPEPGTLLLGGIAAACCGGGFYCRRKRQ